MVGTEGTEKKQKRKKADKINEVSGTASLSHAPRLSEGEGGAQTPSTTEASWQELRGRLSPVVTTWIL